MTGLSKDEIQHFVDRELLHLSGHMDATAQILASQAASPMVIPIGLHDRWSDSYKDPFERVYRFDDTMFQLKATRETLTRRYAGEATDRHYGGATGYGFNPRKVRANRAKNRAARRARKGR